jgi:predicted ArsR family transcriptional regulator
VSDRGNVRSVLAGGPLTAKAVAALTGLELQAARLVLSTLARAGEVQAHKEPGKPKAYSLTGRTPQPKAVKRRAGAGCLLEEVWR